LAIVDVLLAVFLVVLLLLFFACAVWISYLVVFRGWRIFGRPTPPPATSSNPKNNPRKKDDPPPRSRRPGRR
jgi:hypothetical protein